VAIVDPQHLFEQADLLINSRAGRPRQVDLRRAMSAAYYGLFHAVMIAAADQVIGAAHRAHNRYGLVYRSIDHSTLRGLCNGIKQTLSPKYNPYLPRGGFGQNITDFATAVIELQEKRHTADYNPMARMKRSDVLMSVRTARAAFRQFQSANAEQRTTFLILLLFPPRG
jgi:uncharacterized protein (UPF0332 family)